MSLSADESQMNSKSAYKPKYIHKRLSVHECTFVAILEHFKTFS